MFFNNANTNPFANFSDATSAFDAWTAKFDQFAAPARHMSALALEKFEKMTEAQVYSYRRYAAIGVENAQAAMSIHDFASYQNYMDGQKDVIKQVADQVSIDARAFAELGSAFASDLRETSEAAVETAVASAKAK